MQYHEIWEAFARAAISGNQPNPGIPEFPDIFPPSWTDGKEANELLAAALGLLAPFHRAYAIPGIPIQRTFPQSHARKWLGRKAFDKLFQLVREKQEKLLEEFYQMCQENRLELNPEDLLELLPLLKKSPRWIPVCEHLGGSRYHLYRNAHPLFQSAWQAVDPDQWSFLPLKEQMTQFHAYRNLPHVDPEVLQKSWRNFPPAQQQECLKAIREEPGAHDVTLLEAFYAVSQPVTRRKILFLWLERQQHTEQVRTLQQVVWRYVLDNSLDIQPEIAFQNGTRLSFRREWKNREDLLAFVISATSFASVCEANGIPLREALELLYSREKFKLADTAILYLDPQNEQFAQDEKLAECVRKHLFQHQPRARQAWFSGMTPESQFELARQALADIQYPDRDLILHGYIHSGSAYIPEGIFKAWFSYLQHLDPSKSELVQEYLEILSRRMPPDSYPDFQTWFSKTHARFPWETAAMFRTLESRFEIYCVINDKSVSTRSDP